MIQPLQSYPPLMCITKRGDPVHKLDTGND